jgi:hypothetical protein
MRTRSEDRVRQGQNELDSQENVSRTMKTGVSMAVLMCRRSFILSIQQHKRLSPAQPTRPI